MDMKHFSGIIRNGMIDEVDGTNASIIILEGDSNKRKTAPIPVLMYASKFKREYSPLRSGDPVLVFSPTGDFNFGFAIRGRFIESVPMPEGVNEHTDITIYEDGTTISYDTENHTFDITTVGEVNLNISGNLNAVVDGNLAVEASNATITSERVEIDANSVELGTGGAGVVTGACACAFSGAPHAVVSSKVKAI